jgi:hypothetical protein
VPFDKIQNLTQQFALFVAEGFSGEHFVDIPIAKAVFLHCVVDETLALELSIVDVFLAVDEDADFLDDPFEKQIFESLLLLKNDVVFRVYIQYFDQIFPRKDSIVELVNQRFRRQIL